MRSIGMTRVLIVIRSAQLPHRCRTQRVTGADGGLVLGAQPLTTKWGINTPEIRARTTRMGDVDSV